MKTKRENQKTKLGALPSSNKFPRAKSLPDEGLIPNFKTEKMDMDGEWGWSNFGVAHIKSFLGKFLEIQKLTWQELRQNGSHPISIDQIVADARKRLQTLQLDDVEELYSIRIAGKTRLWGIKNSSIFWILLWDPNHEICPSNKKHT